GGADAVRPRGAGAGFASPAVTPAGVTVAAPLGAQHVVGTWVVAPEPASEDSRTPHGGRPTVPAALPAGPWGSGA
ncbi:hypothetical protein, partial [Cellulomonas cellasea]